MPDTQDKPLDEILFGPHAAPADASLAELLSAWYRAEVAKAADGGTGQRSDRTRPDTDHPRP
jgi:hypothetical protein